VPEFRDGRIPPQAEIVGCFQAIAPELERSGVRLAFENARIPAERLSRMIDEAGSDRIGVVLDTVNSLALPEGTEYVARTLARHTMCLHVKDFAVSRVWHMMGFTVEGRPAGQGQLNVPWLIDLVRREGRSANAILELWPPEQPSLPETVALEQRWAVESIAYLRRYVPTSAQRSR
jgi:sugar phosphate isomerase/epimerase